MSDDYDPDEAVGEWDAWLRGEGAANAPGYPIG